MRIVALILAAFSMLFGFRLVVTALQTAISGKVLVRRKGFQTQWLPAPDRNTVLKVAFRDALMGILLIVLGIALFT